MSTILGMDPISFLLALGSLFGCLFSVLGAIYTFSSPISEKWSATYGAFVNLRITFEDKSRNLDARQKMPINLCLSQMDDDFLRCKPLCLLGSTERNPFQSSSTTMLGEWRKHWVLFWLPWRIQNMLATFSILTQYEEIVQVSPPAEQDLELGLASLRCTSDHAHVGSYPRRPSPFPSLPPLLTRAYIAPRREL